MAFIGSLLIGQPRLSLLIAVLFLGLAYGLKKKSGRTQRYWIQPLPAAVAWAAYAAWEWLILLYTPVANIRIDLLVIYPALALLSLWALCQPFR